MDSHQKWFEEVYKKGFENARTRLASYVATISDDDLGKLDTDTKNAVKNATSNCEMVWPLTKDVDAS